MQLKWEYLRQKEGSSGGDSDGDVRRMVLPSGESLVQVFIHQREARHWSDPVLAGRDYEEPEQG